MHIVFSDNKLPLSKISTIFNTDKPLDNFTSTDRRQHRFMNSMILDVHQKSTATLIDPQVCQDVDTLPCNSGTKEKISRELECAYTGTPIVLRSLRYYLNPKLPA